MKSERIILYAGIGAIVLVLAIISFGYFNGYGERLAAVEQELKGISPEPGGADADERDSARLRDSIVARPDLWDPLVPEPKTAAPPPAQTFDLAAALQGVTVLPGGIGVGDAAEIRIATPAHPQGTWFKKGDTILNLPQGAVTIEEIRADSVIVGLTYNGKPLQHRLPR